MIALSNNKAFKNASWLIGTKIVQSVLQLVISMLTARYLGPSNYGIINYAASLTAFILPIMQLGVTNILVQELIHHKESEGEVLGTAIALNLFSAVLCVFSIAVFSFAANRNEPETVIVCILYSAVLIFQAAEGCMYWFQAHLLSKYFSIAALCVFTAVSAYKTFLLATRKSIYWFSVSNALDYMLLAGALFVIYKKLGGQPLKFSAEVAKRLWSRGRYYIVSSMMVTIFAQTDRLMLKHMLSAESVGYYSAAVSCTGMTGFVFSAVIDSFRPVIFEARKKSEELFEAKMTQLYSVITYLSLAQSVVMTAFAWLIIPLLFGKAYSASISALMIVVWYTTFSYYGSVRNIWILSEEKQKYLWIINLSGASANVILNYLMIPFWGINGAAAASLITQFFANVLLGYIIFPIRRNNALMIRGLNPFVLKEIAAKLIKRRPTEDQRQ